MAPSRILLRNRVYLGELNHKGSSHPGQHEPIIAPALFDAVQKKLTANRNGPRMQRAASGALLLGRIFDDRGNRMSPSTAKKGELRYGYYVSSVLAQGRKNEAGSVPRVLGPEIERFIIEALRAAYPDDADLDARALIEARIDRVVVSADSIDLHPTFDAATLQLAWSPSSITRKREILRPSDANGDERGIKPEARTVLLRSIALGRSPSSLLISCAP